MSTYREDLHLGHKVPMVETDDIVNGAVTPEKLNRRVWNGLVVGLIKNTGATAIGPDGYWYVDGVKTDVKAQGAPGRDADVWTIGEDRFWYLNGEKTEYESKGKDGASPMLRVSADGMSLEVSNDGGQTWLPFQKDFNKLRVIGYLDSTAKLPKNAQIGDIYAVWNAEADNEVTGSKGAYELYINTVLDWLLDSEITKVYSYDTELPSSATDGTAVLVPVSDLTLDKEKVDGYKVYKYSMASNGWTLVLNTAEIYASSGDIVNYGDNVYALVQGDEPNTYQLYKRQVGWVKFGTNASIIYKLVQDVSEGAEDNVPSGAAVKKAVEKIGNDVDNFKAETDKKIEDFKEEVKDTYGDYEESPEFVRVYLDNEGHILWGVQADGNVYFGAGVPKQVKEYVQAEIDKIWGIGDVTETIDSLNEIIDFLDKYKNSDSLQKLLEEQNAKIAAVNEQAGRLSENKVDKVDGKGLIDAEFADGVSYIENPEFVSVKLDADGRILEATRKDGTKYFGAGIEVSEINVAGFAETTSIESIEFIRVYLDGAGHILFGIRNDGDVVFGIGVPSAIKSYVDSKISEINSAINVLFGDGDSTEKIDSIKEIVDFLDGFANSATLKELLDKKVDGEYIENSEYISIITDSEDKILFGIKRDGSVYWAIGVPKPVKDYIENILKGIGVGGDIDIESIKAEINAIVEEALNGFPDVFSVIDDVENRVEMTTDADGKILSYRREDGTKVEHSLEVEHLKLSGESGNELVAELKKLGFNATTPVDWSDDEFVEIPIPTVCAVVNIETDKQAETKTSDIKTYIQYWDKGGNYFRKPIVLNAQGSSSMSYAIKNQSIDLDDGSEIKFGKWLEMDSFHIKKYFIDVFRGQCVVGYWLTEQVYQTRSIGEQRPWSYLYANDSIDSGRGEFKEDFIGGALAHPDGFPIKLFFNGINHGIYTLNLKKHRSNYNCKKSKHKEIILDGIIAAKFFRANGDLSKEGENGSQLWNDFELKNPKIDKDINGDTYDGDNPKEPSDDFSDTKGCIKRLTEAISAVNGEINDDKKRAKFEEYFNVPFLIDYQLISNLLYNYDGYAKNWIWCTWDGKLWCPTLYDMDSIFGQTVYGTSYIIDSDKKMLGTSTTLPTGFLHTLYKDKLEIRYKELRDANIFDVDNIVNLLKKWCDGIGYVNHCEDIEDIVVCEINGKSVPCTPSYRDGSKTYPSVYIQNGGWYNSIVRVKNWLKARLTYLDEQFNYNN